ncbi:MAG TPA: hypothetical protein PL196_08575 [Burkholderiaceae bacterium]|nr:hypothetical protein [Burkholderiaceae bacterium]
MAVFTELAFDEVRRWLQPLAVGELVSLQPVKAGIENTNYFVDTAGGGSTLVCAAEDAAWIVVAVCTSEDGDTPKVKDLQRYVEKSAPKGKSRGTLTVSHGLVVTDSAIAGVNRAGFPGGPKC